MSRRPRSTSISRTNLSQQRGVPNARMWSEMPVTQTWSRVAAAGEEGSGGGVAAVAAIGYAFPDTYAGATTQDVPIIWMSGGQAAGDLLIVFAVGPWVSMTPSAGWTTFVSGSIGGLDWLGAWRISDATVPGEYGSLHSVTANSAATWWGHAYAVRNPGGLRPTATVETMEGTGPWQMLAPADPLTSMQSMGFLPTSGVAGVRYNSDTTPGIFAELINEQIAYNDFGTEPKGWHIHIHTTVPHWGAYPSDEDIQFVHVVGGTTDVPASGVWMRAVIDLE